MTRHWTSWCLRTKVSIVLHLAGGFNAAPFFESTLTGMATAMASPPSASAPESDSAQAEEYLNSFLNRTLHLHITDGRMFVGQLKCTDNERNIILAMTHEYRQPSPSDIKLAAERHEREGKAGNVKVDMKKRFVGLVVVPGQYITKMEVEG